MECIGMRSRVRSNEERCVTGWSNGNGSDSEGGRKL